MSNAQVMDLARDLFYTSLLLALPTLIVSLLIGLLISIFQTITSIQEQTLTYTPRIVAVAVVMLFTMSWALQLAVNFTMRVLWHAAEVTQ